MPSNPQATHRLLNGAMELMEMLDTRWKGIYPLYQTTEGREEN